METTRNENIIPKNSLFHRTKSCYWSKRKLKFKNL